MSTIRATVWNENVHERTEPHIMPFYPHGIHGAVAAALTDQLGDSVEVITATLDQPDAGLPEELLARTDVLFWWGHLAHDDVPDSVVDRVQRHVLGGMGLVVLHSGHFSRIFTRLKVGSRQCCTSAAGGFPSGEGILPHCSRGVIAASTRGNAGPGPSTARG
jgi:trehalose utilization protein